MTLAAILAAHAAKSVSPAGEGETKCGAGSVGAQRVSPASPVSPGKTTAEKKLSPAVALLRARLLALAAAKHVDAGHIHRLHDLDVAACIGLDEPQLVACVAMLADAGARAAGRVPVADTAAIHCHHCGAVWVHPHVAACLPVVDGWPRALGCPWCFVRKAGGHVPRSSAPAADAQHHKEPTA